MKKASNVLQFRPRASFVAGGAAASAEVGATHTTGYDAVDNMAVKLEVAHQRISRLERETKERMVTMNALGVEGFRLRKPLLLVAEESADGRITVCWQDVSLFGEGDSEAEALNVLRWEIGDTLQTFESCRGRGLKLGASAAQQLSMMEECIERCPTEG